MNWKLKAAIFRVLGLMPFGDEVLLRLQKTITREVPRKASVLHDLLIASKRLLAYFRTNGGAIHGETRFLEIGAGRDLAVALALRLQGVPRITCIDINRLARLDLIQHAANYLAPKTGTAVPRLRTWQDLRDFGIDYVAPGDIQPMAARGERANCFYSIDVLEHIPVDALFRTIRGSSSLLGYGGISIHAVDYSDHYARSQAGLSRFNFLTYSDAQWKRYNPSLHYVNRLRHSQLVRLFTDAGFDVLCEELTVNTPEANIIVSLADQFRGLEPADLFTQQAWLVCRHRNSPEPTYRSSTDRMSMFRLCELGSTPSNRSARGR